MEVTFTRGCYQGWNCRLVFDIDGLFSTFLLSFIDSSGVAKEGGRTVQRDCYCLLYLSFIAYCSKRLIFIVLL